MLTVALGAAFLDPHTALMAADQVPDQVLAWNQHAYNELVVGAKGRFQCNIWRWCTAPSTTP